MLVQSRTSTRQRRAAARRSTCCPAPFLSGSRWRGCRGCRRPQQCSSQGWHSKPSSRSSRCLPHGLRWLHHRTGPGRTTGSVWEPHGRNRGCHPSGRISCHTTARQQRSPCTPCALAAPAARAFAAVPPVPTTRMPPSCLHPRLRSTRVPRIVPPTLQSAALTLTSLDGLDDVLTCSTNRHPAPTLQTVPVFVRVGVRRAFASSLQHLREAYSEPPDDRVRARAAEQGGDGRILLMRLQHYEQALWPALLAAARATRASPRPATDLHAEAVAERRREAACAEASFRALVKS